MAHMTGDTIDAISQQECVGAVAHRGTGVPPVGRVGVPPALRVQR